MDEEHLLKLLGAKIKKTRESMGLSQEDLAKKMDNKHKSSISNIENGKGNPTIDSLIAVAGALGVEIWDLLRPDFEEDPWPAALQDFQKFIDGPGCRIRPEEMQFLKHLQIKGSPPRDKETYLLFWLLLRWSADKNLPDFLKLEVSKINGDIIGKFTVHME